MAILSLPEVKRLTPPFAGKDCEAEADRYWAERPVSERIEANEQLLREFCVWRGIDIDKPMDKTIRRITREEKDRQHEEWHRAYELFRASI